MNKKTKLALEIIKDNICIHCGELTNEDLRKWFKDKWVNIGKKDNAKSMGVLNLIDPPHSDIKNAVRTTTDGIDIIIVVN